MARFKLTSDAVFEADTLDDANTKLVDHLTALFNQDEEGQLTLISGAITLGPETPAHFV